MCTGIQCSCDVVQVSSAMSCSYIYSLADNLTATITVNKRWDTSAFFSEAVEIFVIALN